jgi:tetratricopeptide (TPR) repeat protein
MSRFNSLEFNENNEGDFDAQQTVKDESFYFLEGKRAFENGAFEQALRFYSKVLEFNPKNAAAWTGQVRSLIELGEFPEAKLWADKALEKFPNEAELLAAKSVALGRVGDLKAALAFSDASIEERGDTPYIWLARGDVLLARAEKRAEYCFQKAIAFAPTDWLVHWLASRIHYVYKKFSIALKFAQDALNLNPGNAAVWIQAGNCQMGLGLIVLAENSFTQARQLHPHCTEAEMALMKISQTGFLSKLTSRFRQLFHNS